MKLCYRGVTYSSSSGTVETMETQTTAKFLGKTYQVRRPIYQPHQEKLNLVYRGVAYSTEKNPASQPHPSQPSNYITKLTEQLGI